MEKNRQSRFLMRSTILLLTSVLLLFCAACERSEEESKQWSRWTDAAREMWETPSLADSKKANFAGAFTGEKGHYFIFDIYPGRPNPKLDDTPNSQVRKEEVDFHGDKLPLNIRWTIDPDKKATPRLIMTSPMADEDIRDKYYLVFIYSHTRVELNDEDKADIEAEMKRNMFGYFDMMREHSERRDRGKKEKEERLKRERDEREDEKAEREAEESERPKVGYDESPQ
ncbi:hypothetical protein IT570_03155 [Candidatus Sumerlaeota bacterium]|nr:hypothetical protein [Candidatus Sumerlaeota bacterium]